MLLLAVFLALATVYSAAVPLGEGPDEPGHAGYAFFLARAGRLPVQRLDPRQTDVPGEGHQPPLAYALAALPALWLPQEQRRIDTIGNPRFTWSGGAELNAVSHGSREYPPWQGAVLSWHLMRLVSAALGAATVFLTYLAARAVDCRLQIADCRLQQDVSQSAIYNLQSAIPLLAAGLVAFNPQFLFISALATNDALLITLSAAMLWLVVRRETRDRRRATGDTRPETRDRRRATGDTRPETRDASQETRDARWIGDAVTIGAVLGLALLTKQSALVLAPVALVGVMSWDRNGYPSLRRSAAPAFVMLATAGVIAGWWYWRNQRLYGDLLGLAAFRGEFATQPFEIASPAAWAAALAQLHASFWARFGWMNVAPPAWALWLIGAIELIALAGLTLTASRRRAVTIGHWSLVALPALAFAWVISFAVTAGLVAWQGRLLFPALPAIAILLAHGLSVVRSPWSVVERRQKRDGPRTTDYGPWTIVLFFVLSSLFLLALWIPENVIRPAYPPQALPESVALERIGTALVIRFRQRGERSIALRGWRLDGPARPGATVGLSLIWYASARQTRDWVVFVHVVDRDGRIVAETERQPRDGAFPTSQWNMGDWIEDQHRIQLPSDLASGRYTLRMGLYDSRQNNRRAGVYKLGGELIGDALDLGSMIVASGG